jgi:hypothetical protein
MTKGKHIRTEDIKKRTSESLKGRFVGEKHPHWKGDSATTKSFHVWLKLHYGKANKCENKKCKSDNPKRFEWANIKNHKYSHKREDYIMLCATCHRRMDNGEYCGKGHKFTEENTYIDPKGHRHCRSCRKIHWDNWSKENKNK